jgi:hypothetical protein
MRPSINTWYQVGDLHLYTIITTIIKECRVSFSKEDISNLCLVSKDFANIVPKVLHWLQVDSTPLQDPSLGYEQQDHIDPYRKEMASSAMIHFGLDPGKFVRFLSGKYIGQYWDVHRTLDAIQDHVTSDNYGHIKQILPDGCPTQLTFKEPSSNKLEFRRVFLRILSWYKRQRTKKTAIVIWSRWICSFANYFLTHVILCKVSS